MVVAGGGYAGKSCIVFDAETAEMLTEFSGHGSGALRTVSP